MHITVVAAVIEDDGRFLLTLRPKGTHLEDHWEFPGGKCEPEETLTQALVRELHEELGIRADVGPLVQTVTHVYPDRAVVLHFFRCSFDGTPRPMLGQRIAWVPRDELANLPFPDADRDLIRHLSA